MDAFTVKVCQHFWSSVICSNWALGSFVQSLILSDSTTLLVLCCVLQNGLGQGALTRDEAVPGQIPSLIRGKEWFLPASIVDYLLSDKLICPVLCV